MPAAARADELPIVTLTELGPNQELPTTRSFYLTGDAAPTIEDVQAVIVRKGSSSMFGGDGPDCRGAVSGLHAEAAITSADDEEEDTDEEAQTIPPRFPAGVHRAFELFPRADDELRDGDVLVSAAWQRSDDNARQYKVLIPHDREFFSSGYGYCLFVVTTERAQEIDDDTINQLIDGVARKIVACGDKSSCSDEALADYEVRVAKELASARSIPTPEAKTIASRLKEAARAELMSSTGIIEARDHVEERWSAETSVMKPIAPIVWADTSSDPFAHALASLLARSSALLPQIHPGRGGGSVSLVTTDGRLQVHAVQLLDDGRSIRVASSQAPSGDQARIVTATTDLLDVAEDLTLYDLIELGQGRVRVDREWSTLAALGERVQDLGLDSWTSDDAAYLNAANDQMKRLAGFVDLVTADASCNHHALDSTEADHTTAATQKHLGEWLVCQHVDAKMLESLSHQLDELVHEDQAWRATKDKLVQRSKRMVTVTTVAPSPVHVEFQSRVWVFSYVTPMIGWAGIVRPDDSFGLFYLGAQIHIDPNPIDDVLWRDGVTTKDLRRALALELAVAPYGGSFGPDHRYSGPGSLPPLFFGLAVHVVPYTSVTFGGSLLAHKYSTLSEEQPHTVFAPYIGLTLQLNLPDLIRQAAGPGSDTTATR